MDLHSLLERDVTVLTASRRLAHALRLDYARHAETRGWLAWRTPKILPWSVWLRQQWIEARAASAAENHVRLLTRAQANVLWNAVIGSHELGAQLLDQADAAQLAARSWQRMHDYLIPLERIAAAGAGNPETRALHAWCSEFARRCTALQAIDEARLTGWAYERKLQPATSIALAGFDAWVPAQARLIERWRSQKKFVELVVPQRDAPQVAVVATRDARSEIELAARWARAQLEAGRKSIGVLVHDLPARRADVARVFDDIFIPGHRTTGAATGQVPATIAAPQPLASYPIVDAAMLVLQLAMSDRPSTDAGRLLRSPFIAAADRERDRRAMADCRLREEQRAHWSWLEIERWAGVTGCEGLQLAARAVGDLVRNDRGIARPSQWAERFHGWLRAAGWPGERGLSSVEYQTMLKLHAALAELGTLDAVTAGLALPAAIGLLQDLLRETPFEAESGAAAVTIIDPMTVAGMTFDAVWVTGLDAARLPGAIDPDPLLPLQMQRAAGIPTASAEDVLKLARIRLQRWTSSAQEVVLSWPQQDGETALQPSPLLRQWPVTLAGSLLLSSVRLWRESLFDARPALTEIRDDRAPALSRGAARGGASTVELQSRCPFRAQAELRLRARPLARVSVAVEPLDRGTILHRVLAEVWSALGSHRALQALDEHALEERVRAAAERYAIQVLRPVARYRVRLAALEVDSTVRQITRLLQLEKHRQPFELQLAEGAEPYVIGGLAITLRPDRIDQLADGGQLLIDYKLGDSHQPRQWLDVWPGRPRRPQLPLYGLAHERTLRALSFVVLAPGAVEYRGWSDGTPIGAGIAPYPAGLRLRPGDPADWQGLMQHWRLTLTKLAEQYVAGAAQVDPLPQECATCHLSTFCRIHEQTRAEAGLSRDD